LYCGVPDVAEELAQEALVRAVIRWDRIAKMDNPEAWLHRVGINLVNSYFRRREAERAALRRKGAGADTTDGPEEAVLVRDALGRLPRRVREAVILRYYSEFSVLEAAKAMDCSERTIKRLCARALAQLRQDDADLIRWEATGV
jgi:RNA polymerase sigma factor (sigma-70 family)